MNITIIVQNIHLKPTSLGLDMDLIVSVPEFSYLLCQHHNLLSFDKIFLKLIDKVDRDEISDEFETSP